jgi:hypothetical protein
VLGPTVGWPGRGAAPPEPAKIPESAAKPKGKLSKSASYGSGVSIPESVVPRRPLWPIALGVGAVAVAAIAYFSMSRSSRPTTDNTGTAATTPVATAPITTAVPAATPPSAGVPALALPEVPAAPSASAPEARSSISKTPPLHPADKAPAHPDDTQKNGKSRVDQRGLAKDNPFK